MPTSTSLTDFRNQLLARLTEIALDTDVAALDDGDVLKSAALLKAFDYTEAFNPVGANSVTALLTMTQAQFDDWMLDPRSQYVFQEILEHGAALNLVLSDDTAPLRIGGNATAMKMLLDFSASRAAYFASANALALTAPLPVTQNIFLTIAGYANFLAATPSVYAVFAANANFHAAMMTTSSIMRAAVASQFKTLFQVLKTDLPLIQKLVDEDRGSTIFDAAYANIFGVPAIWQILLDNNALVANILANATHRRYVLASSVAMDLAALNIEFLKRCLGTSAYLTDLTTASYTSAVNLQKIKDSAALTDALAALPAATVIGLLLTPLNGQSWFALNLSIMQFIASNAQILAACLKNASFRSIIINGTAYQTGDSSASNYSQYAAAADNWRAVRAQVLETLNNATYFTRRLNASTLALTTQSALTNGIGTNGTSLVTINNDDSAPTPGNYIVLVERVQNTTSVAATLLEFYHNSTQYPTNLDAKNVSIPKSSTVQTPCDLLLGGMLIRKTSGGDGVYWRMSVVVSMWEAL